MSLDAVSPQTADVEARLAALEAENARLRERVDGAAEVSAQGGRWRAVLSALCIVIAAILVPVSIVGSWARVQLVDETQFVDTFAPLADDPDVQAMIIDSALTAIEAQVDFQQVTDDLFDGIQSLGLPPRAGAAIDLLRMPAAQGLRNLVGSVTTRLVESEAFSAAWRTALRASHRTLVATATGGGDIVSISRSGEVGIELGPLIAEVKGQLTDQGIAIAALIPEIDRTIVLVQSDALVTVTIVYNTAVLAGWWLPLLALGFFVAGILLARRRSTAVLGTGIGLFVSAGIVSITLTTAGTVLTAIAPQLGVSPGALTAMYTQIVDGMARTAIVVTVFGLIVAVLAWSFGRSHGARSLRHGIGTVNSGLRRGLAQRGVDTGRFGAWMYAQRVLVRVILGVLLALWLLLLQPLGVGDVILILIVGLVVWWLCELVQRRPGEAGGTLPEADEDDEAESDAGEPEASVPAST